ncbi:MAG: hemolysin family protein [Brevinematales bacterium]
MENWLWLNPALIVILLLLSGFFSSSETALFALDEMKLKNMHNKKDKRRIKVLLQNTSILLITILACNTAVNTAAAALIEKQLSIGSIVYSTIAVTVIILFIGDISPKTIAILREERIAALNSKMLYPIYILFSPITRLVNVLTTGFVDYLRRIHPKDSREPDRERLTAILSIVSREDIFNKDEKILIENIVHFTEREVWNIMTPRTKVFSIERGLLLKDLIRQAKRMKMSKIPVYERTDDNLVGMIYMKEIFHYFLYPEKIDNKKAEDIMESVYFVPETKKLSDMLDDFKKKKIRIAAVVDEYGSALGIVTMADVLGEIVGELMDESFTMEKKIIKLPKNRFLVSGELSLVDFNDYFQTELKSVDYETLAGYVIEMAGDIPDTGYSFETNGYNISVREKSDKTLELLMVEKK